MIKIVLIFLFFSQINTFNIIDNRLKTLGLQRPSFLIDVLGESIGPLKLCSHFIKSTRESDYLNELAQGLADNTGCPIKFRTDFPQPTDVDSLITFGFKLRGNITLKEILFRDPTQVLENMSGYLDLRYKNTKFTIIAQQFKELLQNKGSGFISMSSENFYQANNIKGLRDYDQLFRFYDQFMVNQYKEMDKSGNITQVFSPLIVRMELPNFKLKLTTTAHYALKIDLNDLNKEEIIHEIKNEYRLLVGTLFQEGFGVLNSISHHGFGVSMNSNDEITVVYVLGAQQSLLKSTQSRNLNDKFTGYSFQTESGEQISLNKFDYEKDTNIRIRNINNKFLLDSINMNRVTNGLKPVVESGFKLKQLSQNEANRMVSANTIIKPEFKIIDQRSILVAINLQGTTQMKEFLFGFKNSNLKNLIF